MFIEQVDSTLLEGIKHGPRNGNRFCSAMKRNLIWVVRMDFNITGPIKLFRRKHFLDVKVVAALLWYGAPWVTKVPYVFSQLRLD